VDSPFSRVSKEGKEDNTDNRGSYEMPPIGEFKGFGRSREQNEESNVDLMVVESTHGNSTRFSS